MNIGRATSQVVDDLRARGFNVRQSTVHSYIRDRDLPAPEAKLGGSFVWDMGDVQRLESLLRRRGRGPASLPTQGPVHV